MRDRDRHSRHDQRRPGGHERRPGGDERRTGGDERRTGGDERRTRSDERSARDGKRSTGGSHRFDERHDRPHGGKPVRPDRPRGEHAGERNSAARETRAFKPRGERSGGPGGSDRPRKKIWRSLSRVRDGRVILYGWHTVKAALENPERRFHRVLASENAARRLAEEIDLKVTPEVVRNEVLDALAGSDAVHQGLVAEADALVSPAIEDLAPKGLVLVLDQITDPHNVGAILRTAAAFAVEAVVTTERHSPEATGVLAKAASGALEYVPMVTVVNLARGLEALKDQDVLLVGLDSSGDTDLAAAPLRGPLALVLGAEGKGMRHLTRANCDLVARLDLPGKIKSLNVSNATALALQIARTRLGG